MSNKNIFKSNEGDRYFIRNYKKLNTINYETDKLQIIISKKISSIKNKKISGFRNRMWGWWEINSFEEKI